MAERIDGALALSVSSCSLSVMAEPERSLFDDVDAEAEDAALARAEADLAAGRVVGNEAVVRWLKTWGTPGELPPPKCGD